MMRRMYLFLIIFGFVTSPLVQAAGEQPKLTTYQYDGAALLHIRDRFHAGDQAVVEMVNDLLKDADKKLDMKNPSVMDKAFTPPSGNKHDYASLSPYWWPDPSKPDGKPYIRKDGQVNPEREKFDQPTIEEMTSATQTLAFAYFFSGDEKYAQKATSLIRTWYFDDATKMNPNCKYAQSVPGAEDGRPYGVLESSRMRRVIDAETLINGCGSWTADDHAKLQAWFKEFYAYLMTSEQGTQERDGDNNHGTWFAVQAATYALYLGDDAGARKLIEGQGKTRISKQIEPDGKEPLELVRTKAFDYCRFNLEALENLALLGQRIDVDLWNFKTDDGRSLRAALDWLAPYATGEKQWEAQQIEPAKIGESVRVYRIAANALQDPKYEQITQAAMKHGKMDSGDRIDLLFPSTLDAN